MIGMYLVQPKSYEFYRNEVLAFGIDDAVHRWALKYGVSEDVISKDDEGIWHWGFIPIEITYKSEWVRFGHK